MNKIITLGLGIALMSLTGCITSVDGYERPKPKEDSVRAKSYFNLGVAYIQRKRYDLAEPKLRESINIKPELGYMNYYVFLCKYNRHNQIDAIAKTMQSQGKTFAALGQIAAGNCAFEKGRKEQAIAYYNRALQYEPYAAGALLPLAQINYDKGFVQEAKRQVDLVNNQVGYSARSVYLSVLINRELGNRLEERNFMQVLQTRFADSEEAQMLAGE